MAREWTDEQKKTAETIRKAEKTIVELTKSINSMYKSFVNAKGNAKAEWLAKIEADEALVKETEDLIKSLKPEKKTSTGTKAGDITGKALEGLKLGTITLNEGITLDTLADRIFISDGEGNLYAIHSKAVALVNITKKDEKGKALRDGNGKVIIERENVPMLGDFSCYYDYAHGTEVAPDYVWNNGITVAESVPDNPDKPE